MAEELTLSEKSLRTRRKKRKVLHSVGVKAARRIIGTIEPGLEVFTITAAGFQFVNVVNELITQIGQPVKLDISSWTIARFEISKIEDWLKSGQVTDCRLVIDRSFPQRETTSKFYDSIRSAIGDENIRLADWHAKWALVYNDDWSFCVRSSANFNENPRIETYEISDDSRMLAYIVDIMDQIFLMSDKLIGKADTHRIKAPNSKQTDDSGGLDWITAGLDLG